jgi:hypothetical protein
MRLLQLILLSVTPALLHAQAGANADSVRGRSAETAGATADPLRGDPKLLTARAVQARRMQDSFERNRRSWLRFYNGGATASCEVQIAEMCYWNNNGDVPPPAERNDARVERERLLVALQQAQEADATDDWVNGMRVRYALESERHDVAIAAATACQGTEWWCHALQGLALHVDNRHEGAAAAFDKALAAMEPSQRCQWTDLTPWLDTLSQPAYREQACDDRAAANAYILRMAQPLWMMPANDLRNELLARWTISRVHSLGNGWSDAIQQLQVRYGWPTAWSLQNGGVADRRPPGVIGHEPTPSYDFMPSPGVIDAPLSAEAGSWEMNRARARMRYATRYATGFGELPHQFARFRRGDSTVVAGAYRLVRELEMGRAPYSVALVLDSAPGANGSPLLVRRDSARANGALIATLGRTPAVASLEVLAPTAGRAARVRTTLTPLPDEARLSEFLVLQRAEDSGTPSLETAAQNAYGSLVIDPGTTIGLYWEVYRAAIPGEPLQVSVSARRVNSSAMQRLGNSIGLSKAMAPVGIRFPDSGRPDGMPGRTVSVTFPQVPPGDYALTITVSGGGETDSSTQVIRVRNSDR